MREEHSCLEYDESETKFVAHVITKFCKDCYAQQFMIGKGPKEFKEEGTPAVKAELNQMHQCRCFKAVVVDELICLERVRDQ